MSVLQNTSPEAILPHLHETLRNWPTSGNIHDYFLEARLLAQKRMPPTEELNPEVLRLSNNQVLLAGLEDLEKQDAVGGRVLRERFLNDQTILEVASQLSLTEDQVNQRQRKALNTLAHILFAREKKIRQEWIETHENSLPPQNYQQLFGLEKAQTQLAEKLLDPRGYAILNLVGIGGIGKTALAHALTRHIIPAIHFERIVWLRIEPPTLSGNHLTPEFAYASFLTQLAQGLGLAGPGSQALEQQIKNVLRAAPFLIVVDNLEGEAEARLIWPYLQQLAGLSKFLVTSRALPPKEFDLYTFSVMELSREDAERLIHFQAQTLGVTGLAETALDEIYQTLGGNPLALKLVVSLARYLPLKKILGDFTQKRPGRVEAMYHYVYRQTWAALPPEAKAILQAMPLASESGALPDQIQAMSGLAENDFWEALQTLISYSLIEVLGTPQVRRYGIHGLTRSFIQTDIIGWIP
ncbi:MAG: hypothetical protein H6636_13830 [Anaerolineales bacterium]|nr:hypothetical protein [Anaerolineales bacterium]